MPTREKPRQDWKAILRRRADRLVGGWPVGGYTDAFEIVCRDCGDDPALDYREVSPRLQRIRGPYTLATGVAAYVEHVDHHAQL
jgi:hypothetical protein